MKKTRHLTKKVTRKENSPFAAVFPGDLSRACVEHACNTVIDILLRAGFPQRKIARFIEEAKTPRSNNWRKSLPPLVEDKKCKREEKRWVATWQRSVIVAARSFFEDVHRWKRAIAQGQWDLAVKFAYQLGRSVELLQMAKFETDEKRSGRRADSKRAAAEHVQIKNAADEAFRELSEKKRQTPTIKDVYADISQGYPRLKPKNFYKIWKRPDPKIPLTSPGEFAG